MPEKRARDFIVVHIFVALCDNKYQGIAPVPAFLGNGQDTESNLYWGASAGIRGWFNKKRGWRRIRVSEAPQPQVLERIAFERTLDETRMVVIADAYDGRNINDTMRDFLTAAAGGGIDNVGLWQTRSAEVSFIQAGGYADLVIYVGHNGLMDNPAPQTPAKLHRQNPKESAVLACKSDEYFRRLLARAGSHPLILTTGLMAPEAYSVEAILLGKLKGLAGEEIHELTAKAYSKHQKAKINWTRKLFSYVPEASAVRRIK